MKKRILSMVLTLVMLLGLTPTAALAAQANTTHTDHPVCGAACSGHTGVTGSHEDVTTWTELSAAPADNTLTGDSYYLTGDISGSTPITISGEVNLCLNGHKIENSAGYGIKVNSGAALNLCDCGSGGTVTGSYGIYNSSSSSGSVTVNGGAVTGDIYGISSTGTVTVNGGAVTGNTYQGINSSGGTITVNGGTITGNNQGIGGSGSFTLTVTGGTITGKGDYGIKYDSRGTFTLGGSPTISGNTAAIYLGKDKKITVNSDLTGTYSVAIPSTVIPTEAAPVAITAAASADYSDRFTSANASYSIRNSGSDSDQVVQLYVPSSHSHPVCGEECDGHTESHGDVTWTELPTGTTTLSGGSYYLTGDIGGITIPANTTVDLCLNGYKIENSAGPGINVSNGATLNLCDCAGGGSVTASGSNNIGISTFSGNTINVYGGTVTGNGNGYGINSSSTKVNVYGGDITSVGNRGISSTGSSGAVTVYGGTVTGNGTSGRGIDNTNGTVAVHGGTVTGNGSIGYGIQNSGGTVTITGGTVTGNNSGGINNTGTVTMSGGTVTGRSGYGIYSSGTVTMTNGNVTGNNSPGIYSSGTLTVTGGTVTGNGSCYGIHHNGASFTLGGNPTITGGSSARADLYFDTGKTVTVDSGGLTGGPYSVGTATAPTEAAPVAITTPASADYSGHFTSVNASYAIRNIGTGNEQVVQLYKPHSHSWASDWQNDATYHWHDCTATGCTITDYADCGEAGAAYAAHDPVAIGTAVAATCSTAGTTAGSKCSVCGYVIEAQTTVAATDHTWGAWTITVNPTTETTGTAEHVCTKDSTHKETNTVPALTDTTVWTEGAYTAPTEDADGSQVYTSDYGTVTVTIPATGHTHTWGAWTIKTAPTTEATGTAERVCTENSEHKDTITLPVLTDTSVWTPGTRVEPTKAEDGSQVYTSEYGDVTVTLPALGFDVSGTVTEESDDGKETPMSDATVKLTGGKQSTETSDTTDENGEYSFTGVAPGIYNVVVTKDEQTKTILVEIKDGDVTNLSIKMPAKKYSIVELKGQDTPAVLVGGVDLIAEAQDAQDGEVVTVKLTVEKKDAPTDKADIDTAAQGKTVGLYLDLSLVRTVQPSNGDSTDTAITDTQDKVLAVVVPYDFTNKTNVTVYRKHGTENAAALTALTSTPAIPADGTFYADSANSRITIYATKFSTYAIGYTESGGAAPSDSGNSGGGSYSSTAYPVDVPDSTPNGAVSVSPTSAGSGSAVTITVTPDAGYEIGAVTVTDKDGKEIALTDKGGGKYTFTMPAGKVTVSASFVKIGGSCADCPKDDSCPIRPYTDASVTAWYHDGVHYCIENGLMSGYGNYTFGPDSDTNRAMMTTILWRLEGSPAVNYIVPFDDVAEGTWYTEAIRWAAASGIVSGYGNGLFGPNDNITREQLVTMFYHYEQYKGGGFSGEWAFPLNYADAAQVSDWAYEPMCWTTANGIVEGIGNGLLDPKGKATRAQAATMIMRYMTLEG